MWTKAQTRAHQAALAIADKWEEPLKRLAEMAKYSPAFAEHVRAMQDRLENVRQLAQVAVAIDPEGTRG